MEVEGVVEELELRVEATNDGFDTMKSNMKKRKIWRSRVKSKEESKEEMKFDELNPNFLISFIHWIQYIYSIYFVKFGITVTNYSLTHQMPTCGLATIADFSNTFKHKLPTV